MAATVPADELCRPGGVAVGAGRVLDCQLVPLVDEAHARCNSTQPSAVFDDARRCRPPQPALADDVIGWALTADAAGARTLAVYRSGSTPAAGITHRPPAGGHARLHLAAARLTGRATPRPAGRSWRCAPATSTPTGSPICSCSPAPPTPGGRAPPRWSSSRSRLQPAPRRRPAGTAPCRHCSARPVRAIAAERGQGCASPLVAQLRGDGRDLSLGSERAPA
ncbi:MAG: hypothetical protein R2755_09820 [Acidimicrobiales bacterium]